MLEVLGYIWKSNTVPRVLNEISGYLLNKEAYGPHCSHKVRFNGRSIFHGIKFYSFNTPVYVLYHLKNYRRCLFSLRNFHYMLGTRSWCRCDKLLKENLLINATNYLFICTIQYKEKRRFVNNLHLCWILACA